MSDEQKWEAFKAGDREVFEQIFRAHIKVLYKYGSRFTSNAPLVEDCIQDLFIDLWQKKNTLGSTDSIKRYLLGALRRRIIRKLARQAPEDSPLEEDRYNFELVLNIEDELIAEEQNSSQQSALNSAILQLSKRQREVVYLKYFQHLSYEEIAEVMHISYQAARNLVYQTLKALKQHIHSLKTLLISLILYFII